MRDTADTPEKRFPVYRALIAVAAVSIFTPLVVLLLSIVGTKPALHELAALPVPAILFAWPGCVTFLALGLPTLYGLFRLNRTGFVIFALFGALYTALPWLVLHVALRPPRERFLNFVPMFLVIGIGNGIITRLIAFGRRSYS
jgi:uncharacterized BrkB/YihY/UPF0761 family membrane protein